MLEGVSVDPGRTMLPMSPQISLRVEGPLTTGTVECCRRARVSEFCFTPLSPEHAFLLILLEGGGFGWMSCTRGARAIQGQGRKRASSTVTTWGATTSQILALREHLLAEVTCVVIESTSDYVRREGA